MSFAFTARNSGIQEGPKMRRVILFLGISLLWVRLAGADPITITGVGTVETFCRGCFDSIGLPGTVTGDPLTFSLSFNNGAADLDPSPTSGQYAFGSGSFSL